jgi:hypothetical protein
VSFDCPGFFYTKESIAMKRNLKFGLILSAALLAVGAKAAGVDFVKIVADHPEIAIGLAGVGVMGRPATCSPARAARST